MDERMGVTDGVRVRVPARTARKLVRMCNELRDRVRKRFAAEREIRIVLNGRELAPVSLELWEIIQRSLESVAGAFVEADSEAEETIPAPADPRSAPQTAPRTISGTFSRKSRVLVAEHVGACRTRLLAAFCAAGFEAMGVGDGRRAVQALASYQPDVIVADYQLPRLSGEELLLRARLERGRALRACVLIGAELPDVLVPKSRAADAAIGQPFDVATIVELVRARVAANEEDTGTLGK